MLSSRPLFDEAFKVVILSDRPHSGDSVYTQWQPEAHQVETFLCGRYYIECHGIHGSCKARQEEE